MNRLCWALILSATAAWGQAPQIFDLSSLELESPPWTELGVGEGLDLERFDFRDKRTRPPELSHRMAAIRSLLPLLERASAAGDLEHDELRVLTRSPQVRAILERGLAPLRTQLKDLPLVRLALVPLEGSEASALPLGPLSERASKALYGRKAHARISARVRGSWLNARSVAGEELIVSYGANQTGAVPVTHPELRRISTGVAARLRVARRADGSFGIEGVVECARRLKTRKAKIAGAPLDLPSADRVRVVGSWAVAPGRPHLVAACSVPTPAGFGAWGLLIQVVAGPPPALAEAPTGEFPWRHDVRPLLPANYLALDAGDPFALGEDLQRESNTEARADARLEELFNREDLPPFRELAADRVALYATGTKAQQLKLSQLIAAQAQPPRALRVSLGDGKRGGAAGLLRVLALPDLPLCVVVAREARELVGSETLSGGTETHTRSVTVPTIKVEREGFELSLTALPEGELRVQGARRGVLKRASLETRWGEFAQIERQRLELSGTGICQKGAPLALGEGPWGEGHAWSLVEVE